ncbi:MAG: class I SAM-dependent methyltransferase [Deltaproteobacteria bacterium]|nr:class I SAM-dependent methyltransferase [Deltaproteobacteria bacterium]
MKLQKRLRELLNRGIGKYKRHVFQYPDIDPRLQLLSEMPKKAVCAEIGVWKGSFSEQIVKITVPDQLHLIDPWLFQPEFPERMYGGTVAKSQSDMEKIFQDVKTRFGKSEKVLIHRGFSEKVLLEFPDSYFDWIYIDGNHHYDYVRRDIELSYSKVKSGGFIAGDDYDWGEDKGFSIQRAVQSFLKEKKVGKLKLIGSQFIIKLPR